MMLGWIFHYVDNASFLHSPMDVRTAVWHNEAGLNTICVLLMLLKIGKKTKNVIWIRYNSCTIMMILMQSILTLCMSFSSSLSSQSRGNKSYYSYVLCRGRKPSFHWSILLCVSCQCISQKIAFLKRPGCCSGLQYYTYLLLLYYVPQGHALAR